MANTVKRAITPDAQNELTPALLGQFVRARRTQLGLRIEEAAAFCGVAKDTLMKLEHGQTKVQLGTTLLICKRLGIVLQVRPWEEDDKKDVWV